jgi:hypothetical protein
VQRAAGGDHSGRARSAGNCVSLSTALGIGRDKLARLDLDALRLPDRAATKEAEAAAGDFPPWLWHHSQRSYV